MLVHSSAREHVTWPKTPRTVTLPPPFEKACPRALYSIIVQSNFIIPLQFLPKKNSYSSIKSPDDCLIC